MTKSKNDMKKRRAEALGMPYGTAEKRLRKQIIFELARQLGKTTCCSCGGAISSSEDLAVVHVQDWLDQPDQYWDLTNVAFSHSTCAARRGGSRQEEAMSNNHIKISIENWGHVQCGYMDDQPVLMLQMDMDEPVWEPWAEETPT